MYFVIALIMHLFGIHSAKPYLNTEEDKILDNQRKFKCCICNKICNKDKNANN